MGPWLPRLLYSRVLTWKSKKTCWLQRNIPYFQMESKTSLISLFALTSAQEGKVSVSTLSCFVGTSVIPSLGNISAGLDSEGAHSIHTLHSDCSTQELPACRQELSVPRSAAAFYQSTTDSLIDDEENHVFSSEQMSISNQHPSCCHQLQRNNLVFLLLKESTNICGVSTAAA